MKKLFMLLVICFISSSLYAQATISAYIPKWTVMLYITSSPDLEKDIVDSLVSLKNVGDDWDLNVVVEIDWGASGSEICSAKKSNFPDPYYTGVSRYVLTKHRYELDSHLGEINMGDANTLNDFLKYCHTYRPGRQNMLIIGGHGSGWESYSDLAIPIRGGSFIHTCSKTAAFHHTVLSRAVNYDDLEADSITVEELRDVITRFNGLNNKKLDILVFDSCLMMNFETMYQLKDAVKYFVGSEAGVLSKGTNYEAITQPIKDNANIGPYELSKKVSYAFVGGGSWSNTLPNMFNEAICASFSPTKCTTLVNNINELVKELFKVKERLEFTHLMGFGHVVRYFDINRICKSITDKNINFSGAPNYVAIRSHAVSISQTMGKMCNAIWTAGSYNRESLLGLGIWWPEKDRYKEFRLQYKELKISKDCLWDEFLDYFVLGTVRYSIDDKVKELSDLNNNIRKSYRAADPSLDVELTNRNQLIEDIRFLYDYASNDTKAHVRKIIADEKDGFEELQDLK